MTWQCTLFCCTPNLSVFSSIRISTCTSLRSISPPAMLIPLYNTFGAWLIGLIVSAVLFGVTCLQVYLYFTKHCTRDPAFVKSFVALLLSLDTFHLALTSHVMYSATITNFGEYTQLVRPTWSFPTSILIGFLLSVQVQLFYAFRIYIISNKQLVMPIIIAICAFAEFGLGIVFMRKTFQAPVFIDTDMVYPASALSLVVVCDVLVAAAMIYYLLKNRSEIQTTNRAINLLVSCFVSSGALTMVFAICSLVTLLAMNTMIYTPFFLVTVRLYALSFMTILNCREHVRERLFSSQAMVTLPPALSNIARSTNETHESIVFDNRSKNEAQEV
ncbi:hypothetical protein C8R47DRAFT_1320543 [Mycena vitilis]|nr:hypothetical protein C8R47DRAFT_1320543 [Mycena vitilis]